jgi:hypothetical protein
MYLNTSMPKLAAFEHTIQTPMRCYGILNSDLDPLGHAAWTWAQTQGLPAEAHLNCCRYWLPTDSALESEFLLRYTEIIHRVPQEDYI